ncbi:transcriptional regulator, LacI family [Micromonospora pattaloongensis]|uniref:Transcriptional regulator, LacI family n=1 Tax=Micromonospora pattaloongensis TaxID=405436 RepID=A0A1H3T056_9ACTN|nr:LacI family DNA-binding transcriptional regulator [Micromonospora pattaloongensis]SDZ42729.1 transcriptional regulator, LacI family [Micromonospora pattaloongensis]
MTKKVVRLSDVALAAGTSAKTASRVINGDPRVSVETRQRVEEAVERLGYRVDLLARSLRRGVDDTIGVIVESIADPFFAAVISEIELAALRRGLNVIVASNRRLPNREATIVDTLQQRRVAGLIVTPHTADLSYLATTSTPVVFVDRHPKNFPADVVVFDDRGGARTAVRHLIRHGHERIAFVSDDLEIETSRNRYAGYVDALTEVGLPVRPEIVATDCAEAPAARARTSQFLDLREPPTAIFSARSETSLGVVKVLHDRGRTDIAVVSFGDFALADVLSPAITVLEHSPELLGRLAVERLFDRLDGTCGDPVNTVIPLRLVPRGSGEIVAPGKPAPVDTVPPADYPFALPATPRVPNLRR